MTRYIETDTDVYFPKVNARHHISFVKTYRKMTIPQARRKMRALWAGKSLQNEMIHYLKEKGYIHGPE
jgi:hypothetical protein